MLERETEEGTVESGCEVKLTEQSIATGRNVREEEEKKQSHRTSAADIILIRFSFFAQ